MLSCPRCGGLAVEGGAFCQNCGAPLRPAKAPSGLACRVCGTRNPPGTNFCHSCGEELGGAGSAPTRGESGPPGESGRLIAVRRDGTDGESYPVTGDQLDIGRSEGELLFDDPHLAPRHARIIRRGGQFVVSPLETRNGVYVRVHQPFDVADGDQILLGKQVVRFELLTDAEKSLRPAVEHGIVLFGTPIRAPWGRLRQMTAAGTSRDVYHLTRAEVTLGREQGDIVFSDDEFLSRRHAQLQFRAGRVSLLDLGSSNGTYVRLRGQHALSPGDMLRLGDELLRFEIG